MYCKIKISMEEYLGNKVGNLLRIIVWAYLIFCVLSWGYFMITTQEIPNDCSFFSLSAHIGFMVLLLILMLLMICT